MKQEHKDWIDNASYEQLLYKWRHAPMGNPFFMDDTGEYYEKVMREKKQLLTEAQQVASSKRVDW